MMEARFPDGSVEKSEHESVDTAMEALKKAFAEGAEEGRVFKLPALSHLNEKKKEDGISN